jgi:poly(3-hydroxybutyrate) depolymerase
VLAGSPIDTDAGDGPIKRIVHDVPMSFYEDLVALGGGLMKGRFMLQAWKNMQLEEHFIEDQIHVGDPTYLKKENFELWYENPMDLPGRWYLQVVREFFKENRLVKGSFIGLGRRLDLQNVTCPVYLLAGEADDIATKEQVFAVEKYIGTPKKRIKKKLVPGGHIGLFLGARTLQDVWPSIARWIAVQ